MWIFYFFVLSCVCYVFVRVCLYVFCGHLLGSRLLCLTVSLSLSLWYPWSGVVLDCIDSSSLHPYLLCLVKLISKDTHLLFISASLTMSISVLKALPGKLDIKRLSPSILYISASLAMSTSISKPCLVSLISKDTHLVFSISRQAS